MADIDTFIELSLKAVREQDVDKFMSILMNRSVIADQMKKNNMVLHKEEAARCIALETTILERLEEERKKALKAMDGLSKSKAAIKTYSPAFPFPPMPVFFDKQG